MSGKEQRIDASACVAGGLAVDKLFHRGRGEAQNRFVRAHDEVCNARAR
ncbi:hypothetical protein DLJ82_5594 (plasmid) [Rhizobium leguminosarum]|uniref:Uncharacterized protein n=1 Tax=Rhizobium leguminosarum TaxID=384 RepID=A0A2Z4YS47_RHILE|nr:hypothetical protein DLJ82_5594 [Rhizobium leguminosarum]